eukprot:3242635-Rhodomonas_salina.1
MAIPRSRVPESESSKQHFMVLISSQPSCAYELTSSWTLLDGPQIQESANKVRAMGQAPQRKAITDHEVNMLMKGFNIDSNYEIRVQRAKDVTEESIEYLNHEIVAQNMEQLNRHLTRSGLKYADSQRAVNAGLSMNYKAIFLDRDPHYARH